MVSDMEEVLLARIISGESASEDIGEKAEDGLEAINQANLRLVEMNERIDDINDIVKAFYEEFHNSVSCSTLSAAWVGF